jgi:hypothetical protein
VPIINDLDAGIAHGLRHDVAVEGRHDGIAPARQDKGRLLEGPKPGQARPTHHGRELGLGRQRNRVVHDPWSVNALTGSVLRLQMTADRKLEFKFKPVELKELNDLDDKIVGANEEFMESTAT